jgi:uncharacterized membrane protein
MRLLKDEDGRTLVLTALCTTALLGFMALALDVGVLFRARRNMQIAADAAAMAGTTKLFYNGTANVQQKAFDAAKANGVDQAVSGNIVNVTLPPVSVGGKSCATCVEVRLATPNPTVFMGITTHSNSLNVAAMAVAGSPSTRTWLAAGTDSTGNTSWTVCGTRCNAPGNQVQVRVSYAFPLTIPFWRAVTLNLSSKSSMVISQ